MRRIVDAFAEYERLVIKARTKAALSAKRRRGERSGQVPFGMAVTDDGRRSKKGNLPVALAAAPAEQDVIPELHRWRSSGWSLRRIAKAGPSRNSAAGPRYETLIPGRVTERL